MNDMHNLLLKVDSLTYNAMQVLNALIRSAVASGSSSGYKVTKYGNELVLTRSDIYKLNNFYELWEAAGFPSDEKTFNRMLTEADARWRKAGENTTLATDAVVKHSQILFMTERDSNKVGDGDTAYWTDKVRTSGTPKATVGTAPIPINLRTPLYDENLSTKSFSQYETYLFPMGYRRAEILGTPGNGDDYLAGGANWTIDASEILSLKGNHITLGNITNPQNRIDNYGDSVNTISWGVESYALRDNSLAFGVNSAAVAENAIVFGEHCIGYGKGSFIGGGRNACALGTYSFASNEETRAVGGDSFAANHSTHAGTWTYAFTFPASSTMTPTDCSAVVTEDACYVTDGTAATTVTNYNIIRIDQADVEYSAIVENGGTVLDIKVGDRIAIYDTGYQRGNNQISPVELDGYARDKFETVVTSITVNRKNNSIVSYDLTLADPIPVDNIKYTPITGGYVTVLQRMIPIYNSKNQVIDTDSLVLGSRSASFGESTIARGECQAVFGEMNVPNDYARMIVGIGSYIADEKNSRYRANGLLISEFYSYMKLPTGSSVVGVSCGTYSANDAEQTELDEGAFLRSSYVGFGESRVIATGRISSLSVNDDEKKSVGRVIIANDPVLIEASQFVTAEMSAYRGCAVISSGSYISGDVNAGELVDTLITDSPVIGGPDEHGIAIYAQDGIDIRNTANSSERGINIETCSYLTLTFKELAMHGNTYGTLTASDNARSFVLKGRPGDGNGKTGQQDDILYAHTVGRSGFYGGQVADEFKVHGSNGWNGLFAHIISSAFYDDISKKIQVASISIPSSTSTLSGIAHPVVTAGTIVHPGNENQVGDVYTKELAFLDDANGWTMAPMAAYGYKYGAGGIQNSLFTLAGEGYQTVYPISTAVSHIGNFEYNNAFYVEVSKFTPNGDNYVEILSKCHANKYTLKYGDQEVWNFYMNFSLTGNHLDLTVDSEKTAQATLLNTNHITAIRIPILIGCAINNSDSLIGGYDWRYNLRYGTPAQANSFPLRTYIAGTEMTPGAQHIYDYKAYCLRNGLIVLEITLKYGEDNWTNRFVTQFSGAVPFEASSRCCHGNINADWQAAMEEAYNGKAVMQWNDLLAFLGDNLRN